jgi:hypothetical protein
MNAQDVLKTYAMFYVSENDEFDSTKKLDMLNFIEQADESMMLDLFENGEIEAPFNLMEEIDPTDERTIALKYGINIEDLDISSLDYETVLKESQDILEYNALDQAKDGLKNALGMKMSLRGQLHVAGREAKAVLKQKLSAIDDKIDAFRNTISKGASKAVKAGGEALEKGKEMAGDAGEAASKAGKAAKGVTDNAGKAIEGGVKTATKAVKGAAETAGDKISGAAGKAAEFAQSQPGVVGAAVAAAAALTAGVMAYRRFFSKAAQACKTNPDRKACLAQYKMKAKQAQIAALNSGKAKCAKTKNPGQCKAKIDGKINALKAKMRG